MALTPMSALPLRGRRVLIRQDLNVPLWDGEITSARRVDAALHAIRLAVDARAKVLLLSHAGRPQEGRYDPALSLAPVADYLSRALGGEVKLCADYLQQAPAVADGEVVVLENVRFNRGEKANDAQLAKRYAALCDVFVFDAFGAAHRAHASTAGVARYAPLACAGPLLLAELDALDNALTNPKRPLLALVGGAKVSSKLNALDALSQRVDYLIPGGGIANTFLAAAGHNIGKSLHEPNLIASARELLQRADARGKPLILPQDAVVAKALSNDTDTRIKAVTQLANDDLILDLGPASVKTCAQLIRQSATVLWNGPVGAFEYPRFAAGTEALAHAIADSPAFSVAGGGDTLAAIERFNLNQKISYTSTGGGAFLTLLEGKPLPAVAALERANKNDC